jgi:hypothetical protein
VLYSHGLNQGFSTSSRPEATATLSYQLMGRKVINEDTLLNCCGSLLKNGINFRKQDPHIVFNKSVISEIFDIAFT